MICQTYEKNDIPSFLARLCTQWIGREWIFASKFSFARVSTFIFIFLVLQYVPGEEEEEVVQANPVFSRSLSSPLYLGRGMCCLFFVEKEKTIASPPPCFSTPCDQPAIGPKEMNKFFFLSHPLQSRAAGLCGHAGGQKNELVQRLRRKKILPCKSYGCQMINILLVMAFTHAHAHAHAVDLCCFLSFTRSLALPLLSSSLAGSSIKRGLFFRREGEIGIEKDKHKEGERVRRSLHTDTDRDLAAPAPPTLFHQCSVSEYEMDEHCTDEMMS